MNINKRKSLAILAVAGVFAASGSAFTATSTIDKAAKTVGATSQAISGVNVSNVSYTWDSATDTTTGVDFTIGAALGTNDTLVVELNTATGTCALVGVSVVDYACSFTGVVNAEDLSIVVN